MHDDIYNELNKFKNRLIAHLTNIEMNGGIPSKREIYKKVLKEIKKLNNSIEPKIKNY